MADANKLLTGSDGNVWLNGLLLGNLKSIEAKVTGQFEDVEFCGDDATYSRYTGWTGEGSLVFSKIDSFVLNLVAEGYQKGIMPQIKVITKLRDRTTQKSERVAISGITITEFILVKFEAKKLIDEELPYKFTKYELLEKIA